MVEQAVVWVVELLGLVGRWPAKPLQRLRKKA